MTFMGFMGKYKVTGPPKVSIIKFSTQSVNLDGFRMAVHIKLITHIYIHELIVFTTTQA